MPQLLLLYYILLYEDVRLSNTQNYINAGREVKSYSAEFLSEFPIKYLLQQAQKDQQCYSGMMTFKIDSSLLTLSVSRQRKITLDRSISVKKFLQLLIPKVGKSPSVNPRSSRADGGFVFFTPL